MKQRMFVPGPVDVADEVLAAQTQPMLPHRSKEFEAIYHRCVDRLKKVYLTEGRVLITASSGTGWQEAAIRNLVNERVLSCVNGAFGKRWHEVAISNGKQADLLEFPWEQPVDPQVVADHVRKGHYEAITIVHNETSTGMENPVAAVAEAVRRVNPDVLILVDAVSSFSGAKIETDAWGLDLVLTSSQKALALPPGLGFAAISERAMKKAESVQNRGWYFDIVRMANHQDKNSTPATPAISLIYALDQQLERILAEGIENRFQRHNAMATHVHAWAETNGYQIFAPEGFRSRTVTTLHNQYGWSISELNAFLLQRGMRLANGYGPLKNNTFRIAHMGELTIEDLDALFAALEEYRQKA